MVGGVNAAATFAVVPLGALWVLTRTRGPRRRSLLVWWPAFTLLGTLWWLRARCCCSAPTARRSSTTSRPASVTTFPTTLVDALRGTSNWVPYVDPGEPGRQRPGTTGYLAINSGVVLLVGLPRPARPPHPAPPVPRRSASASACVMVTAGHVGAVDGWFAARPARAARRRAVAAAQRAQVRPGHPAAARARPGLGARPGPVRRDPAGRPCRPRLERVAFTGHDAGDRRRAPPCPRCRRASSRPAPRWACPTTGSQAADYLAEESDGGVALLAPGSTFGSYVWGTPRDEPLQWLADSRWAVRNVIPLDPARQHPDARRGRAPPRPGDGSLAPHGLPAARRGRPPRRPQRPGAVRRRPRPGAGARGDRRVARASTRSPSSARSWAARRTSTRPGGRRGDQLRAPGAATPPIEVFDVGGTPAASRRGDATVVAGGPEDLLDLMDLGVRRWRADRARRRRPRRRPRPRSPPTGSCSPTGCATASASSPASTTATAPPATPATCGAPPTPSPDYTLGGDRRRRRAGAPRSASTARPRCRRRPRRRTPTPSAARGPARCPAPPSTATRRPRGSRASGRPARPGGASTCDPTCRDRVTLTGGAGATDNQSVRVVTAAGTTERVLLGPGRHARGRPARRRVHLAAGRGRQHRGRPALAGRGRAARRSRCAAAWRCRRLPESWGAPDAVVLRAARDARTGCVDGRHRRALRRRAASCPARSPRACAASSRSTRARRRTTPA